MTAWAVKLSKVERDARDQRIISLYTKTNLFCTEIAKQLSVDKQLVYDVLKKHEIIRTHGRKKFVIYLNDLACDYETDYLTGF